MERTTAIITDVFFGIEDHGLMTCNLTVEGDGWGCGFGGYSLSLNDGSGMSAIKALLETLGVRDLCELKNQPVRLQWEDGKGESVSNRICKIGHIVRNKWFSWREFFDHWYKEEEGNR